MEWIVVITPANMMDELTAKFIEDGYFAVEPFHQVRIPNVSKELIDKNSLHKVFKNTSKYEELFKNTSKYEELCWLGTKQVLKFIEQIDLNVDHPKINELLIFMIMNT